MARQIAEHARWNTEETDDLSTSEAIDPRVLSREYTSIGAAKARPDRLPVLGAGDGVPHGHFGTGDAGP
jgi:hypothetical protein